MPRAIHWGAGLVASGALHLGAAALYLATYDPAAPKPQQVAESRFQLDTLTAPTQDVAAQTPQSDDAAPADATSTPLAAGTIRQGTATAQPPTSQTASAVDATGTRVAPETTTPPATQPISTPGTPVPTSATNGQTAVPLTASSNALGSTDTAGQPLPSSAPAAAQITSQNPASTTSAPTPLPSTAAQPATPLSAPVIAAATAIAPSLPTTAPSIIPTSATRLTATPARPVTPSSTVTPASATSAPTAAEATLPAISAKAATAWQFGDRLVTDPAALATIQAFMAPSEISNATEIKDNLSNNLAQIPCARIQATFLPETGTLDIQGHIPDPTLRDTVLQAMQAQVGDEIPVTANLLHLPEPQCASLTGISNVGLPQSTDQFTSDRLIGQTAQARDYTYAEGQRLQFDLVAPDYDAYVYVDYFAADGTVIHLVPNDVIALERIPAKSLIGVGTDTPGKPGLQITIAPPFGQEIAVAFASSEQLYSGLRPTVEPAGPYLAFLTDQVTAARSQNSNFKGEWVYFHMTTKPATQ